MRRRRHRQREQIRRSRALRSKGMGRSVIVDARGKEDVVWGRFELEREMGIWGVGESREVGLVRKSVL